MKKRYEAVPLSESNVSLNLVDIQRRCSQLIEESDGLAGLALEDASHEADNSNPYDRG